MQIKNVGIWLVFVLVFWGFSGRALDDQEMIKGFLNLFDLTSNSETLVVSNKDVGPVDRIPEHAESLMRRQLAEAPSNPMALPPAGTTGDHHSGNRKTIIIVIVFTAVGTFVVATLLFLCARKAFSRRSNDSSSNARPSENPTDEEKMNTQVNLSNFTRHTGVASAGIASSSTLKPPRGRHSAQSPGFSPPAPPPGPPASLSRDFDIVGGPPAAPPPKKTVPPPPPPGPPPPPAPRAPAPPPPKGGAAPSRPPASPKASNSSSNDAAQVKLKPFFWDKVMADPDHSMVWDQFKSGSFQFNEEMIESLFGYAAVDKMKGKKKDSSSSQNPQHIQLIDQKKAQNLSILLRALNVTTEEIRDALLEGHELPSELLETLLKMAPTTEEESKLRLFSGEISQLGPAERFLKAMVDIPFAFKRMEALQFMVTLQEEVTSAKKNFTTLEAACKEVRSSRLFLKLLEAVLKTGNRMNDGTYRGGAHAFKLDTLLKLADVKGTDGKTTLLHFVVQEMVRSEGVRAARESKITSMSSFKSADITEDIPPPGDSENHYRSLGLEVVSGLGEQLQNVMRAAGLDSDIVTGTIIKLGNSFVKAKNFLKKEMDGTAEEGGFHKALRSFIKQAEGDVMELKEEEKRIMTLVMSTTDYFHGSSGKEEGFRLFVIVRDFVIMLEKVCREVKAQPQWPSSRPQKTEPVSRQTSSETPRPQSTPDFRKLLFPAIAERRVHGSSSDDDDDEWSDMVVVS